MNRHVIPYGLHIRANSLRTYSSGYGWLLLVCLIQAANAQVVVNRFAHWSVKDGLSHNSVNCIFQDRDGYMWFGTNDGLNRFDGHTFTVFQHDPTRPAHSLQTNRVTGLCEDQAGRLWATTEGGGLHEINKRTGAVTPHTIQTNQAHRWNSQMSVYEDSRGILWISAYDGLIRYNPDRHHFVLYPSPRPETNVKAVFEDRQHRLWVATTYGLYQFDRQTGRFSLILAKGFTTSQPWFDAFFLDAQDVLWLGTVGNGLLRLDLKTHPLQPILYNPGGQINPYVYLNAVHGDKRGFLWVGTTAGLQRIDPTTGQVVTYRPSPDDPHGISSANAQAIFQDQANTLWVGTDYGVDQLADRIKHFAWHQVKPNTSTVNLLDNKTNTLLIDGANQFWTANHYNLYRQQPGPGSTGPVSPKQFGSDDRHKNYAYALLGDSSGDTWLGTWDGLYRIESGTNRFVAYPSVVPAQLLSRGPTGLIWLGGEGGIASFDARAGRYTNYRYDPANTTGLPDKFVYALLASRTGDVWVAINGKGISRLNPATGQFTHYTAGREPGRLNTNDILTFYEDRDGIIWIGTSQGGLNRFDPQQNRFSHVTTQNGLPSNRVVAITADKTGRLWLSTNKGICRFNPRTNRLRTYDTDDGLPSNDFLENAVFKQANTLYFGSLNGGVRFNPDSIQDNTQPFPVYITGFSVLDQQRPLVGPSITLRHNENFLSFEFVALTYVLPEQNQYAYQLVGVDDRWVANGTRRFANYTKLAPGDYTFRVRAANSDGIWNNRGTSVRIHIRPPWWQTWWAYGLYGIVLIGSFWGIITYRSRQLLNDNRRLEETVTLRTAEVSRQRNELSQQRDNLEKTLLELTDTQNQLIQKEKMASLGELTAGIAHEIQNPLNFVNNFSDLSAELTADLATEVTAGRQTDALYLIDLLGQNLRKIVHHGRRAENIVKGMLEHTRISTGQKEPTDLNKLTDEYLRLAYHGLRAKDDTFTASFTTEFDPCLTPIAVIPQEIGRALLNIFNNAFYSMAQKQKHLGDSYQPTLTVSVRQTGDWAEIRIRDNGLGIPQGVVDKIYQPFFTTKPPGEGTGLGLSLSYDSITKVHRGQLIVDTQEKEFAEFIIRLPLTLPQHEHFNR